MSQTALAEQVGRGHATVSRWLERCAFPEQQPRPRKTGLAPDLPYLAARWAAGCHTIAQLYRELVARGSTQSDKSVSKQLVRFLPEGRKNPSTPDLLARPPVLARQAVFLFLRRSEKLSGEEQVLLLLLRQFHPEVDLASDLVQPFAQMVRNRTAERLDAWLARVSQSRIPLPPVLCHRSRERQRGGESWTHLVDQERRGGRACDQAEADQTTGLRQSRFSSLAQAGSARHLKRLITFPSEELYRKDDKGARNHPLSLA